MVLLCYEKCKHFPVLHASKSAAAAKTSGTFLAKNCSLAVHIQLHSSCYKNSVSRLLVI